MCGVPGRSEHTDAHVFCEVGHSRGDDILTIPLVCMLYTFGYVLYSYFLKKKNKGLPYNHKRQSKMTCILCRA